VYPPLPAEPVERVEGITKPRNNENAKPEAGTSLPYNRGLGILA
jgi:hypothetical protein